MVFVGPARKNKSKISVIDFRVAWQLAYFSLKNTKSFLTVNDEQDKILMRLPKQFEPMLLARGKVFEECNLGECNLEEGESHLLPCFALCSSQDT